MLQIARYKTGFILTIRQCDCVKRNVFHVRQHNIGKSCFDQNAPQPQFIEEEIDGRGGESELITMQGIGIFFEDFLAENGRHAAVEKFSNNLHCG